MQFLSMSCVWFWQRIVSATLMLSIAGLNSAR